MNESKFNLVMTTIKSRLLFQTEKEYVDILGHTLETIINNRKKTFQVDSYYGKLDATCRKQCSENLTDMLSAYQKASDICDGVSINWGECTHISQKKRICRWLFRNISSPLVKISASEKDKILKFIPSPDKFLNSLFHSYSHDEKTRIVIFMILISYNVIDSINLHKERARDYTDDKKITSYNNFISLLTEINGDAQQLKHIQSKMLLDVISKFQWLYISYSIADYWNVLKILIVPVEGRAIQDVIHDNNLSFSHIELPGIWIDDSNQENPRFWIFPTNTPKALCYTYQRSLKYELSVFGCLFREVVEDVDTHDGMIGLCDLFHIGDVEDFILGKDSKIDHYSPQIIEFEKLNQHGFPTLLHFERITEKPEWMNWKSMHKLNYSSPLFIKYLTALKQIYTVGSEESALFNNTEPMATGELPDCLVAIDSKYLYIKNSENRQKHRVEIINNQEVTFTLTGDFNDMGTTPTIFEIEISKESPLYMVPREINYTKQSPTHIKILSKAVAQTTFDDDVFIVSSPTCPNGILYFPSHNTHYDLSLFEEELSKYGGRKVIRKEDLFKHSHH